MKTLSRYMQSVRSVLAAAMVCATMVVGNPPQAHAATVVGSLGLVGIYSGAIDELVIATAIGLPATQNMGDYLIGSVGSGGGATNGFTVSPNTYLKPPKAKQPIGGTWEFNPAASGFTDIGYLIIAVFGEYGLYKVNYGGAEGDIVQGLWTTVDDLGGSPSKSYRAYATPQVPIPAADILFSSALLLGALGCRSRRKA